jgi:hypothetical protein
MKTILKSGPAALVAALSIAVLSGCTSMQPQAGTPQASGLMCNKCETVWVPSKGRGGKPGTYHAYRASEKMICPQCESMAETFFRTGRFSHSCPGCGSNVMRCTVQVVGTKAATSSMP